MLQVKVETRVGQETDVTETSWSALKVPQKHLAPPSLPASAVSQSEQGSGPRPAVSELMDARQVNHRCVLSCCSLKETHPDLTTLKTAEERIQTLLLKME